MIDKSIRQHYDNKYSAKNRKGLDEGGWGGDESWGEPSDNGGNDDGGWSPSVSYSPPASTPSPHRDTAADLMAEVLIGKSVENAKDLFQGFHELVAGEGTAKGLPKKLSVFSGVREFPIRVKCATLAWHTVIAALENANEVSTE